MNFLSLFIVGLYYFGKRNIWNFLVILALVGITGLGFYQSAQAQGIVDSGWWSGMWQNFATEMIGAILTFALFEMLINSNERQETLVRQMASSDNATAINAVNELRALGYLFDGTLHRKSLKNANLQGVDLSSATLTKADFSGADLKGADLTNAVLESAKFDARTILPDGTHWTPQTDLTTFTNTEASSIASTKAEAVKRPQSHPYRAMRLKRK